MLTLDEIMKDSLWVVKLKLGRVSCSYEDIEKWAADEDCIGVELCAVQPAHLRDFFDKYFMCDEYISIKEYYNKYYAV